MRAGASASMNRHGGAQVSLSPSLAWEHPLLEEIDLTTWRRQP